MISNVFIISKDGDLCYSKAFLKRDLIRESSVNLLVSVHRISREIGGGNIKSLNFTNFSVIFFYDEFGYIYLLVTDSNEFEDDLREKLSLLKSKFCESYHFTGRVWDHKTKARGVFDAFVDRNILIPPNILLVGEQGVGKSTIMDLFPGETVLELDDDMNEIIQKTINLPSLEGISEFILREVNMQDLVGYSKIYKMLLDSADIICLVTNSGAGNLSRTKQLFLELKQKTNKADFYIIANFQDLANASFEPEKINESFGIKTFGFSAIRADAKDIIYKMINTILKTSIIDKIENKYNHFI